MLGPPCLTIRPSCLFFQGGPVFGRSCLTIRPSCLFFPGRTSVGTSMFNYQTSGQSWSFYNPASFTPTIDPCLTDVQINDANLKCGNISECIYDYCITGDETVATETKTQKNTYEVENAIRGG